MTDNDSRPYLLSVSSQIIVDVLFTIIFINIQLLDVLFLFKFLTNHDLQQSSICYQAIVAVSE